MNVLRLSRAASQLSTARSATLSLRQPILSLSLRRTLLTSAPRLWEDRGGRGGGRDGGRENSFTERPRFSATPKAPCSRIWVGNLPFDINDQEFYAYFPKDSIPGLLRAILPMDPATNRSRGFGFLEFDDVSAATAYYDEALQAQREILGRTVRFEYSPEKGVENRRPLNTPSPVLFVGGLSKSAEEQEVKEFFEQFGTVARAVIAYREGEALGFAHVEFANQADAEKLVNTQLEGGEPLVHLNRRLRLDFAMNKKPADLKPNNKLFLTKFYDTYDDLRDVLEETGLIDQLAEKPKLLTNFSTGLPTGAGFLVFNELGQAEKALELLNGRKTLKGTPMSVTYSKQDSTRTERPRSDRSDRPRSDRPRSDSKSYGVRR